MRTTAVISTLVTLTLGLLITISDAQAQVKSDSELWSGLGLQVEVRKRIRIEAEMQHRRDQGWQQEKNRFHQFAVRYRINKWLYVRPSYRMTRLPELNSNRNRTSLDVLVRWKKKDFPLQAQYRLRVQHENTLNTTQREIKIRNRIGAKYNLSKRVDPELSAEWFMVPEEDRGDVRLRAGLDWRVTKNLQVSTFYALERELGRKFNDRTHIVGLQARLRLKIKKPKSE